MGTTVNGAPLKAGAPFGDLNIERFDERMTARVALKPSYFGTSLLMGFGEVRIGWYPPWRARWRLV